MAQLELFVYNHDEREFSYFDGDRARLEEVMAANNPDQISDELEEEAIDGLLVLDEDGGRWYLAFSSSLGIVGQRTARRQADTIVRSGYTLPDGYWLKANYPMEELNDPNIGDLWQTVQQKYVKDASLTGLELDEESGIPRQLAERAKEMEKVGENDALAEAKLEKAEAEERAKAAAKSKTKPKKSKKKSKKQSKKKASSKKKTKEPAKKEEVKETKKETPKSEEKPKSKAKAKAASTDPYFIEVNELAEYVHNNYTRMVAKGSLTDSKGETQDVDLIFDQSMISSKEWNGTVVFLEEEAILEVTIEENKDGIFATSVKAE